MFAVVNISYVFMNPDEPSSLVCKPNAQSKYSDKFSFGVLLVSRSDNNPSTNNQTFIKTKKVQNNGDTWYYLRSFNGQRKFIIKPSYTKQLKSDYGLWYETHDKYMICWSKESSIFN